VRSFDHSFSGKAKIITYSECVLVALVVQHAICMSHIFICGLSDSTTLCHIISLTVPLKIKRTVFNIKCVLIFSVQILSGTFLILRINERDVIKNIYWFHENYVYSCQTVMRQIS